MIIRIHKVLSVIAFLILPNSFCLSISIPVHFSMTRQIDPYYIFNIYSGNIQLSQNNWSFNIKPVVVDKNVGKQLLGTSFTQMGLNGRITHSYLQYKNDYYSLFLGRSPMTWGQSKKYSIIQSGSLATYDHISFSLKMSKLTGEILTGQLGSETMEGDRITRLIGGHRVTSSFLNDKLVLQVGEQIIYTGENRHLELFYLNPAVPYVFAAYDGDDWNQDGNNNDNGMIFLNGQYLFDYPATVFFEFIMDDYQIHDNPIQNMLGYKLGFQGKSKVSNLDINWETEYTQIDSWTYIHHGQSTNWQNRGHAIGYPYGPDLRSFYIHGNSWLKNESLKFEVEYTWMEKGENNINTSWGNNDTLGDPFPSKPVITFHLFEASILYKTKYATLQTGYTNKPFPYEIANGLIDELEGGFFLSAGLHYQMDINLKE